MKKILITTTFMALFGITKSQPIASVETAHEVAIEIAIDNFVKSKLSKGYNVFSVSIDGSREFASYEINKNITTVSILPTETANFQYYIGIYDTIGSKRLPTRYIIKEDKLFYWYDSNYSLSAKAIINFQKYKLAKVVNICNPVEMIYTNDRLKAAQYYFCKNNLKHYKRVITWKAIGWYKPPRLRCEK